MTFTAGFITGVVLTVAVATSGLIVAEVRYWARREVLHRERARARDWASRWSS